MAQIFTFSLDSFRITDTRSRHNDTDYVSFTLLVKSANGTGTPKTLTKSMGDVNNGTHKVGLTFSGIPINPTDTVTLNYLIVNSGHGSPSQIVSGLESAGTKLATAGGAAIGGAIGSVIPGFGTILLLMPVTAIRVRLCRAWRAQARNSPLPALLLSAAPSAP